MSFLVDDAFPMSPKVTALLDSDRPDRGEARYRALALWTLAGAHCKRSRSRDGAMTAGQCRMLLNCTARRAREAADELVRVGLWVTTDVGYRFHEWTYWQAPKKGAVDAEQTPGSCQVAVEQTPSRRQVDATQMPGSCPVDAEKVEGERNDSADLQTALTRVPARASDIPIPSPIPIPDPLSQSARGAPSPNGVRAEKLRTGYLDRWERQRPDVRADGHAYPGGGGPWLDLARAMTDEQVAPFLDAVFADEEPFLAKDRAPSKLPSQRVRLLTQGPTRKPGSGAAVAAPLSPEREALAKAVADLERDPNSLDLIERHRRARRAVQNAERAS